MKKVEFVLNQALMLYLCSFSSFLFKYYYSIGLSVIFPHSVHDPSQFLTLGIQENTLRQTMYARNVLQFHA